MSVDGQTDETIRAILTETHRIAVVGASDKAWRPSHGVFGFLLSRGYDAVPVNPMLTGRATLYGTAVGGEAGASKAINIIRTEMDKTMAYTGCNRVDEITTDIFFGDRESNRLAAQ